MPPATHVIDAHPLVEGTTHDSLASPVAKKVRSPTAHLYDIDGDGCATGVCVFHVPLEIHVEKLEDEVEFLICMDDVQQPVASRVETCERHAEPDTKMRH